MRVRIYIDGERWWESSSFKPGDAWTWKSIDHGISIGVQKTDDGNCRVRVQHGASVRMINHRTETKGLDYWSMEKDGDPFAQYDVLTYSVYSIGADFITADDRDATRFVNSSNPSPGYYVHSVWEETIIVYFERVTFHVYYHANGRGAVVPQPTPFKITGSRIALDYNASRLFHNFLGYDTSPTSTHPRYVSPMNYYPGSTAYDVHLYAIWEPAYAYLPVRSDNGLIRGANNLVIRHGDERN